MGLMQLKSQRINALKMGDATPAAAVRNGATVAMRRRVQSILRGSRPSTTLPMVSPTDASEREAECVADAAVGARGDATTQLATRASTRTPRTTQWQQPMALAQGLVQVALDDPGQRLDQSTRAQLEANTGQDFANVRIHTDATAAASASLIGAKAYAMGQHIVFSHGAYSPQRPEGRWLLAHELAHVSQQRARPHMLARYPGAATIPTDLQRRVDAALSKMKGSKLDYEVAVAEAIALGVIDVAAPDFFDTSLRPPQPMTFAEATTRKQRWEHGLPGWEALNMVARVPGRADSLPIKKGVNAYTQQFAKFDSTIYLYTYSDLTDHLLHEAIHINNPLAIEQGKPGWERERFVSELRSYYFADYRG